MGNTKIQDSTTGNIMGLRDGFVPLGMKEHGGVLYIASYNLNTKEGELGTIPSPVFNYIYNDTAISKEYNNPLMAGTDSYVGTSLCENIEKYKLYSENSYNICDTRLRVGDKFLFSLKIPQIDKRTNRTVWLGTNINCTKVTISFPYISQIVDQTTTDYKGPGWFKLNLVAKCDNGNNETVLTSITNKNSRYWLNGNTLGSGVRQSDYWFIKDDITELDAVRTQADNCYITYPNVQPGYLYVKLEPEMPKNFALAANATVHIEVLTDINLK